MSDPLSIPSILSTAAADGFLVTIQSNKPYRASIEVCRTGREQSVILSRFVQIDGDGEFDDGALAAKIDDMLADVAELTEPAEPT